MQARQAAEALGLLEQVGELGAVQAVTLLVVVAQAGQAFLVVAADSAQPLELAGELRQFA